MTFQELLEEYERKTYWCEDCCDMHGADPKPVIAAYEHLQDMVCGLLFARFGHWPLLWEDKNHLGREWLDMLPELEAYKERKEQG